MADNRVHCVESMSGAVPGGQANALRCAPRSARASGSRFDLGLKEAMRNGQTPLNRTIELKTSRQHDPCLALRILSPGS
jgi:hypothetical protein